ncbi:PAN domain-containing protein At5g03700 [Gastrolobium bilobum]|uniref:PAN domain-containing protein At5g03700 n=1 Tax=Gastrolobium bilobum TaxID=150636 RepID=UPI002AB046C3|nr:PAN domain-containing protein At5g03700 [Gastrolobium bilobum]
MFNMSATHQFQFTVVLVLSLEITLTCFAATSIPQELHKGFSAAPQSTTTSFETVLSDPTGNFSLGFLRHNQNQLTLAVIHVASSEPLWVVGNKPTHSAAAWSVTTRLFFNGSLVLWDPQSGASWSTATNGDRVVLLNTSNLQVQNNKGTLLWESFNFPINTLVQGQNFTANMSLMSGNGLYSLRLGDNYMGLYTNYGEEEGGSLRQLLYWKHTALEARAEIDEGKGPIYAQVNENGYLGMYQSSPNPVDVQKFNSFQQAFNTSSFLLVRLEPDGNLKGYYWNTDTSTWLLNYQAITDTCELPSPCDSYGLCTPGGSGCSCLDNRTRFEPGGCLAGDADVDGDLCGERMGGNSYWVLRRTGVEPPHKELLGHVTTSSLAECEGLCQNNCSCWGALYSNATGFCYVLDYPIQTMLGTGDESKVGYFKVRKDAGGRNRVGVRVGVVVAVLVGIIGIIIGIGMCRLRWKRRKGVNGILEEENGVSPGPYKNLGSASFRSIEMCNNAQ